MHRRREGLGYGEARRYVLALVSAAEAYFGSWGKALHNAGIDPNLYFVQHEWRKSTNKKSTGKGDIYHAEMQQWSNISPKKKDLGLSDTMEPFVGKLFSGGFDEGREEAEVVGVLGIADKSQEKGRAC